MTAMRLRALTAIVVMLVTVVWVLSAKPASTAPSRVPTVSNYLVRIARAMGLESRLGPRAPVDEYLRLLVQHGVISADAVRRLRTDQPLTRDVALEVSSHISDPAAPSFLSKNYVVMAFHASNGSGAGFNQNGNNDNGNFNNGDFNNGGNNCPTPNEEDGNNNDDNGDNDSAHHGDNDNRHHHGHHGHHDHDHCDEG